MGASAFDQSTTAASNSDIGGVNQAEGCAPSTVNNATRALAAQMKGALIGVTASGTDTYTATLAPAPDALTDGMTVHIRFTNANATTTPTLNINSLGATTIVKNGSAALVAGDIPAGHEGELRYNGTNWVLLNPKTLNGAVLTSRSVISGAGLTGGGDLSADRTLVVGEGTGIIVNADDVAIRKATQSEMQGETSNRVATADNMKDHPGVAKAWVVFNGTSSNPITKDNGYNISGTITKNGTGDYTVTWSTAFANANYSVCFGGQRTTATDPLYITIASKLAGSIRIKTAQSGGTLEDYTSVTVTVFGNQ